MQEQTQQTLSGTVETIVFRNDETGFTVLELAAGDELVTVVGELVDISVGESLTATGSYTTHAAYGLQFKASLFERQLPSGAAAISKYLASGSIKGLGPVLAQRIVEHFGDNTLEIIEKHSHRLSEIKGISPKKAGEIAAEYGRIFGVRSVMLALAAYGIDTMAAIKAWKLWGALAPDVIRANPYSLCSDVVGLGFEACDTIAEELGLERHNPLRIRSGLGYILRHNLTVGHTCLPYEKLLATAAAYLQLEHDQVEPQLQQQLEENQLAACQRPEGCFVSLPEMLTAESYIAGRLRLMLANTPPVQADYTAKIDALEAGLGLTLAQAQRKAIAMALCSNIFILTGGPGTGKTTTLNGLIQQLKQEGAKVALAAPTGRAAKRMSEVTGLEAKTLHRLLEVDFHNGGGFRRNEKNPLPFTTIIVDEVSMVDVQLLEALLRAMRLSCRLVLVGDCDQLPSVGAGNLLGDLLASDLVPTVRLTEIFRQASSSLIVTNAHSIVRGELPELTRRDNDFFFLARSPATTPQTTLELATRRLPQSYNLSPLWDIQVIVPGRKGALGADGLNQSLQNALNPAAPGKTELQHMGRILREGDKVMQIRNNYDILWESPQGDGMGIFNGDIGVIEMIDRPSSTILVRFDDRTAAYTFEMAGELEHAYAITIHKSQGSEFEAVIMPLAGHHPKLHYRNLLYTGVTRARRLLVMVGQESTVAEMVRNHRRTQRYTNLRYLLESGEGLL